MAKIGDMNVNVAFTCVTDNGNPDPFNRPLTKLAESLWHPGIAEDFAELCGEIEASKSGDDIRVGDVLKRVGVDFDLLIQVNKVLPGSSYELKVLRCSAKDKYYYHVGGFIYRRKECLLREYINLRHERQAPSAEEFKVGDLVRIPEGMDPGIVYEVKEILYGQGKENAARVYSFTGVGKHKVYDTGNYVQTKYLQKITAPTYTAPIPTNHKQPINRRKYYIGQSLVRHYPDGGRIEVKVKEIHNDHLVVVGCKWFKVRFIDVDQVARFDKEELSLYEPLGSPAPQPIKEELILAGKEKLEQSLKELDALQEKVYSLRRALFPLRRKVICKGLFGTTETGVVENHPKEPYFISVSTETGTGTWSVSRCTPID